jgi:UDP-N-acetylmuramoylalanine--D-glutamate ligase
VRFSQLEGARVGVWGAGAEIVSFAAQLARRLPAARIVAAVFDNPPPEDVAQALGAPEARIAFGAAIGDALGECEVLVRSPGVSVHKPELQALREAGTPVTTPTALWLAEREGRGVIGVTGTKGKSTTAALACHLARASGAPAHLAGNIGRPALDLLDTDPHEPAIVELSSYHVADLDVGPEVVVITNLFPEHAAWHRSEQNYRAEKLRLLTLEGVRIAVLPARQLDVARAPGVSQRRLFGLAEGWDATARGIALAGELKVPAAELALPGEHNALNLWAALTALEAAGIGAPELPGALTGFEALAHRLQTVAERDGVTWVDDSISTTPESTLAALASFPGREIVLLAGGQDRGQDYAELARELTALGASVYGLGTTGERLVAAALAAGGPEGRALAAPDLAGAVQLARASAGPGAVVLLSPAAPSYDEYRDFQERGERFAALALGSE